MKVGVVFPQTEIGRDPAIIRDYAQAVEAMGYTHILAFDSVVGPNPDRPGGWDSQYDYRHAFHEPLVLFGFLAAVTRRIELATGVLILPQRQTALVAKQAAEVDVLSGGRLRLGIGVGWNPVEFEALGEDIKNRGRRVEEQLEVMRLLWTRELVTYAGRWHRVPDAGINPLPVRRPVPVWMGGESPAVLRRAARLATAGSRSRPSARGPRRRRPWTGSSARSARRAGIPPPSASRGAWPWPACRRISARRSWPPGATCAASRTCA
jgi:probable F420-dependent oxidoreductase